MTCPSALSGWAGRIIENLGDSSLSTGSLVGWFQYNLPKLNLSIGTSFYLNSSGCIEPEMTLNQSGIYEELHYCDYLRRRAAQLLGGTSFQDVVEVRGEEQGSIRWASSKERSKEYRGLAQDCNTNLSNLIDWYSTISGEAYAYQVLYNLRSGPASYGLQFPPGSYYDSRNTVWSVPFTPY